MTKKETASYAIFASVWRNRSTLLMKLFMELTSGPMLLHSIKMNPLFQFIIFVNFKTRDSNIS